MLKDKLGAFFNLHHKKFIILPLIIIILSFVIIGNKISTTGDFVDKDISLKGGILASVYTDKISELEMNQFISSKFPGSEVIIRTITDFSSGKQVGITIEATNIKADQLKNALLEKLNLNEDDISIEEVGSSLGESFYKEMLFIILFSFIFMGIVVFVTFRVPIPSLTVILCAFSDIIGTLAVVDLLGIKLSTGGIAAFLMLIGYSVDTDILLTTRILRRKEGSLFDRIWGAGKPGLSMTITTIVAVFIGFIFSVSPIMKQIFLIILIGGIFDIFNTWITNTTILYRYCKWRNIE